MLTINYSRVVGCEHDAQIEMRSIGKTTEWQDQAYEGLPIYQSITINLQMTNSTSTDVTLEVHIAIEW